MQTIFSKQVKFQDHYIAKIVALLVTAPLMFILSSCASTNVDTQWINPDFSGRKLVGKVLVLGVSRDDTVRRVFEDEMAAQLSTHALTVVRSHEMIAGSLVLDSTSALLKAANSIGADTILSSVVVDRQYVERLIQQPLPSYNYDFGRWYGYYWPYAYSRAELRTFERYTVSTSLTDVATGSVIWSARTQTESTDHVDREIKPFVSVIIQTLVSKGLL
jgi:hypothetical protein